MARPSRIETRDRYRVFSNVTTRWKDNDVFGHINNAVYNAWMDTAVTHFLPRALSRVAGYARHSRGGRDAFHLSPLNRASGRDPSRVSRGTNWQQFGAVGRRHLRAGRRTSVSMGAYGTCVGQSSIATGSCHSRPRAKRFGKQPWCQWSNAGRSNRNEFRQSRHHVCRYRLDPHAHDVALPAHNTRANCGECGPSGPGGSRHSASARA